MTRPLIVLDDQGTIMYEFTFTYTHMDKQWGINLFAYNWDDARKRVQSIKKSLVVEGKMEDVQQWD